MTRLCIVLLATLPMILWIIPLIKGVKELNRSERYEAISKDPDVESSQRNDCVRHALNFRKRSETYLIWFCILVFLHYFAFSMLVTIFPLK